MTRVVVDASVVVASFLPEAGTAFARQIRARLAADGGVVPPGWSGEVANALLVAERRGRLTPAETEEFLTALALMPIAVDDPPFGTTFGAVLALARAHHLTAYDAAYLELAVRQRLPLATLDDDLKTAARSEGVALIEPG